MQEAILKNFFLGKITTKQLKQDLTGEMIQPRIYSPSFNITDMDSEFKVLPEHLIRVCDAMISGELEPYDLFKIGFCVVASDNFELDTGTEEGVRVSNTVIDWADYEINYLLTLKTALKFKERLLTGNDLFTDEDINWNNDSCF